MILPHRVAIANALEGADKKIETVMMDDFNFYRFIAYFIGAIVLALVILKLYLIYSFKKLERSGKQPESDKPNSHS